MSGMPRRKRIPVAVVNGTGYGGVELLRLLRRHPTFEVVEVTARSEIGKPLAQIFPHLAEFDLTFSEHVERADLVFIALPDHAAIEIVPDLLTRGRRVVDLSAGFRLRDAKDYTTWYGYEHAAPALLEEAVYGLTESVRDSLPAARLVACPGCYPTAGLLAISPALVHNLIHPDIIVDAKSGLSGAGRTLALGRHYSEANEDTSAYGLGGHRHWPEMLQSLEQAAQQRVRLTFTPHYVPMTRGILATCYAPLRASVTAGQVQDAYHEAYAREPFVRIATQTPHTKWTIGSNLCFTYPIVDQRAERLIVVSAIDNLVKGAAGQAIQCANLMYGLPEAAGLPQEGVYP